MKRDMELVRKILFKIEEEYKDSAIYNLKIDGYDLATVAYHCNIIHGAGLVMDYGSQSADDAIYSFGVSGLTWEGQDFLEKIREDTVWNKTKTILKEKGLPMIVDVIKDVSSSVISSMVKGTIKGLSN